MTPLLAALLWPALLVGGAAACAAAADAVCAVCSGGAAKHPNGAAGCAAFAAFAAFSGGAASQPNGGAAGWAAGGLGVLAPRACEALTAGCAAASAAAALSAGGPRAWSLVGRPSAAPGCAAGGAGGAGCVAARLPANNWPVCAADRCSLSLDAVAGAAEYLPDGPRPRQSVFPRGAREKHQRHQGNCKTKSHRKDDTILEETYANTDHQRPLVRCRHVRDEQADVVEGEQAI